MSEFDPTAILRSAQVLESGTLAERLDLVSSIDLSNPVSSGMLMRALEDEEREVRLAALQRLAGAGVRPVETVLDRLLDDEEEEIRELALDLRDSPDALNPLEQLIPMVEKMADSLGPVGGVLRDMVGTLRDMGSSDEKTQLRAISQLSVTNPTSPVAIQQALQSQHISVRIAALKKASACPTVTVPEDVISPFLDDPSDEVRTAAEMLVQNGQVGPFDEASFREQAMQSMLSGVMGPGAAGMDLSQLGAMFGQPPHPEAPEEVPEAPEEVPREPSSTQEGPGLDLGALAGLFGGGEGSPDLSALAGLLGGGEGGLDLSALGNLFGGDGAGPDLSALGKLFEQGGGGLDFSALASMLGGGGGGPSVGTSPVTQPTPSSGETARPRPSQSANRVPHVIDGWLYVVGDERMRDRVLRSLAQIDASGEEPDCAQIAFDEDPPRWAISLLAPPVASPGWTEMIESGGTALDPDIVAHADQARRISEQVWGAAFADHSLERPITLVFHDGMLSRAEWGGEYPGAWSAEADEIGPSSNGPLALLRGFLADPTDDHLITLPQAPGSLSELD